MGETIKISFKKHESELYDSIMKRCELIGVSGWMKQAAKEKIEREEQPKKKCGIPNIKI